MPIPTSVYEATKDLLRIPAADFSYDNRLGDLYTRVITEICREQDWLVERQDIPVAAGVFTYEEARAFIARNHLGVTKVS